MDRFSKRPPWEDHFGRMMRNMSFSGLASFQSDSWTAATDIYETEKDFILYMDVAGINPEDVSVVVEEQKVIVSGRRQYPLPEGVKHIHQLEIDRGRFEKTVSFHRPIEVTAASSAYRNGFLIITMPKRKIKGKVRINVR